MTNTLQFGHLTEEDLDDVLIGCASDDALLHAAECEACGAQILAFQSSMTTFNTGTMAWAQAKSNTVSRDLSAAQLSNASQPMRWSVGVATMAAMACVLTVGLHRGPSGVDVVQAPVEQSSAVSNEQEIAADNDLLEAINSEMSTTVPAPLQSFRHASVRMAGSPRNSVNEVQN